MIQLTKKKNRLQNTCELYIKNWSYSYKVGIVFTMCHIMISNGTYWAGRCHEMSDPITYLENKYPNSIHFDQAMCEPDLEEFLNATV